MKSESEVRRLNINELSTVDILTSVMTIQTIINAGLLEPLGI